MFTSSELDDEFNQRHLAQHRTAPRAHITQFREALQQGDLQTLPTLAVRTFRWLAALYYLFYFH